MCFLSQDGFFVFFLVFLVHAPQKDRTKRQGESGFDKIVVVVIQQQ